MSNEEYNVIGVMSGTSLDGIDLVYCNFEKLNSWSFKLLKCETVKYSKRWYDILKNLVEQPFDELDRINETYTKYLSKTISNFIYNNNIESLDLVSSHGHTALHKPEEDITFQIGNKKEISNLLKQTVVCDFRVQDVKLGGQGAPLVPIGDKLLFGKYTYCLNLGGFANISYDYNGKRIAFDICPVNIVLNHYCRMINLEYDSGGKISASGTINEQLLESLNALGFYNKRPPKSLGIEWVKEHVFPLIDVFNLEVKDILRTYIEHVAIQISKILDQNINSSVLTTGGGAHNSFLMSRIRSISVNDIILPENNIIDFKEALVFG